SNASPSPSRARVSNAWSGVPTGTAILCTPSPLMACRRLSPPGMVRQQEGDADHIRSRVMTPPRERLSTVTPPPGEHVSARHVERSLQGAADGLAGERVWRGRARHTCTGGGWAAREWLLGAGRGGDR